MAIINLPTTSELVTPVFESGVFNEHPEARYFLGVLSVPGSIEMPEAFTAARQLRANVYIGEKGYLPQNALQTDGGESDADDSRSVQFGVIENIGHASKMVGTSRLIVKDDKNSKLPIENMFPDSFGDILSPKYSTEVSRFIARHPNKAIQHGIGLSLMRAMSAWALTNSLEPGYAVIEKPLARIFDRIKLPYEVIGETKPLEEYANTLNMPIRLNSAEIIGSVVNQGVRSDIMQAFFQNALTHMGLGYFDETLTKAS